MQPTQPQDERAGLPSASYIDAYNRCPGKRQAEVGLPDIADTAATEDGNKIHENLEFGIVDGTVSQQDITKAIERYESDALAKWKDEFDIHNVVSIRETRFWIHDPITLKAIASAKPDVVYHGISQKNGAVYALVINYKSGFKDPLSTELSWQNRTEVISVWQELGLEVIGIRGATLASRFSTKFDPTDYTPDDITRLYRELRHILWRTEQQGAPRVPGDQCRYCRAQGGHCEEAAAFSLLPHVGVEVGANKNSFSVVERVQHMSPIELGLMHKRRAVVNSIFDQIEARLKGLSPELLAEAGYKLVPGNKNKAITDAGKGFTLLGTLLTDAERVQCISITRSKAADIVAEKFGISKDSATEKVEAAIAEVLVDKPGNPRLKEIK